MSKDEEVDWMIDNGYIGEVDTGVGKRYYLTDKFKNDHPDVGKRWDDMVSVTVATLWEKELLDVEFVDDEVRMSLTDKVSSYDMDKLSGPEYAILTSIAEWLVNDNG